MPAAAHLDVRKTYKLYVNGEFVRSESGRTLPFKHRDGVANIARATKKDLRDAVRAARTALGPWHARTAYNRGQILYRLAEMMEDRRGELLEALERVGSNGAAAAREVDAAIDRVVWYAGWCDKIEQWLSTKNPVAGPHFNVSSPEPSGIVGVLAPDRPGLLGLISTVVPPLCAGDTVVAIASEKDPLSAIAFAEALATCDLPAGVVAILTSERKDLISHLARHMDVNALDLWISDAALEAQAADLACENVKRVRRHRPQRDAFWFSDQSTSPRWIEAFMEIKTVWHPAGL
jgi:acyl-CoA reductase-like NAD-dependent aldehyde dehydrogenase